MRTAIAAKILTGEISAVVTITPESPNGTDTSSLLRHALSGQSASYKISPLKVAKFRKVLESMAMGNEPDLDVLRQIEVDADEAVTQTTSASTKPKNQQPHQDGQIIIAIRELGLDPNNLPADESGKPGTKSKVKTYLQKADSHAWRNGIFSKAWDRFLTNKKQSTE